MSGMKITDKGVDGVLNEEGNDSIQSWDKGPRAYGDSEGAVGVDMHFESYVF